jgi:acyl carrier protein
MPTQITPKEVESVIVDGLVELGYERELIAPAATFESLDVDSLDLVELAQLIEEEFGVELESTDVAELSTVGDAIELVVARV